MQRLLPLALAACATLFATPAFANGYSAAPTSAAPESVIAKDVLFKCGADGCVAGRTSGSRPAIVCAALVREIGAVESFSADGAAFDAAALAKCNARAKGAATATRETGASAQ